MKRLIVIITISLMSKPIFAQGTLNMSLKYHWADTTGLYFNTFFGVKHYFNEIWGWHNDSTGREYAIMGAADGTYFFDVTNTDSCYKADYIEAKDRAEIHRDYKSYKNYVYMVADEGDNSLQIFDMNTLPDSVTLVYDSSEFVERSHNIFIDEGILYMVSPALNGPDVSGFRMLDLTTDPTNPTLIADFYLPNDNSQGSHIHDLFVRERKAYCSNGNAGFFIYDVSDPNNIFTINSIQAYTEQGYNHNSWMTEDCSTLFFTDETLGMGIKSYDIRFLDNISLNKIFRSNEEAMAHNVLVHGNMLYVSYYHDGVVVFDITDPANPVLVAQYDTFDEQNGYDNYQGCWGVYPYLPSGTVLASDFENGLFVLEMDSSITPQYDSIYCREFEDTTVTDNIFESQILKQITVYPNPANQTISFNNKVNVRVEVVNSLGEILMDEKINTGERLNIDNLSSGLHFVKVYVNSKHEVYTFIKE